MMATLTRCQPTDHVIYTTPWGVRTSVHKLLLSRFKAACEEAYATVAWTPQRCDGYVCRLIRGSSTTYSRHAYAAAWDFFDIPITEQPDVWGSTNAPSEAFCRVFEKYGFTCGRRWTGRPDYPHIEWSSNEVPPFTDRKEWDEMATKEEIREVVRDELTRVYRLLTTGDKDKAPASDKVNLRAILEEAKK